MATPSHADAFVSESGCVMADIVTPDGSSPADHRRVTPHPVAHPDGRSTRDTSEGGARVQ
jgi:hypothetical protein